MKTVSFPGGFTPPITGGPFFGGPEGQKEALKLAFDPGAILDGLSSLFRGDFKRALDKLTDGLGGAKSKGPKKLAKEAFDKLKGLLGGRKPNRPEPPPVSREPKPAAGTIDHVDPNKVVHIFGNPRHKLDEVVTAVGSREEAFRMLQRQTQAAVGRDGLTDTFETVVNIKGYDVTVRGKVVDGTTRIGTAFRRP